MVFNSDLYFKSPQTHVFKTKNYGVFQTIQLLTARQPNKLPNTKTQNSSFHCTAALPAQQLSLNSQPATAQTNRPYIWRRAYWSHCPSYRGDR
jgi:hypothetical protein